MDENNSDNRDVRRKAAERSGWAVIGAALMKLLSIAAAYWGLN